LPKGLLGALTQGNVLVHAAVALNVAVLIQNGYPIRKQADHFAILGDIPVLQVSDRLFVLNQLGKDLSYPLDFIRGHQLERRFP